MRLWDFLRRFGRPDWADPLSEVHETETAKDARDAIHTAARVSGEHLAEVDRRLLALEQAQRRQIEEHRRMRARMSLLEAQADIRGLQGDDS